MLFSLDNDYGALTTIVVSFSRVLVNEYGLWQNQDVSSFSAKILITVIEDITTVVVSLIKEIIFRSLIGVIIFRSL